MSKSHFQNNNVSNLKNMNYIGPEDNNIVVLSQLVPFLDSSLRPTDVVNLFNELSRTHQDRVLTLDSVTI